MRRWLLGRPTTSIQARVLAKPRWARQFATLHASRSLDIQHQQAQTQIDGLSTVRKVRVEALVSKPTTPSTSGEDAARALRARHLLRHILRECTYLPDPYARQWMNQHILARFRTYTFKAWKLHQRDAKLSNEEDALAEVRLRAKEKEARSWLAYLKRANEGERKPLMRVLFMAYGRTGKRRWELLAPLLPKPAREDVKKMISEGDTSSKASQLDSDTMLTTLEDDVEAAAQTQAKVMEREHNQKLKAGVNPYQVNEKSTTLTLIPSPSKLSPQLLSLLKSQIQHQPPDLAQRKLRRIALEVPALNNWLQPMPKSRIRNKERQHLNNLLEKALPPLPTEEWEYLLGVASGQMAIPPILPRRKGAGSDEREKDAALETVVAFGKPPTRTLQKSARNGHNLTSRFMRRLYAQVLSQCCSMEWDRKKDEWRIVWGEQALAAAERAKRTRVGGGEVMGGVSRVEVEEHGGLNGYHDWVEWR